MSWSWSGSGNTSGTLTWIAAQSSGTSLIDRTSDAKSETVQINVRALFARKLFTRFLSGAKLLKRMVPPKASTFQWSGFKGELQWSFPLRNSDG